MRKRYQETFDQVHASGKLRMEVKNMTAQGRTGRTRRFPKTALIAAMLVLALAGTAVAAEALGMTASDIGKRTGEHTVKYVEHRRRNKSDLYGYDIAVKRDPIPVESLPAELLDSAASIAGSGSGLELESWEAGEAFWGLELPDNSILGQTAQMASGSANADAAAQRCFEEDCRIYAYCREDVLLGAALRSFYRVRCRDGSAYMPLSVEASFVTEHVPDSFSKNALNIGVRFRANPDNIEQNSEVYITPSGLETVIVTSQIKTKTEQIPVTRRCISAYFVRNDVVYELSVNDLSYSWEYALFEFKEEEVLEILKQILDAYE